MVLFGSVHNVLWWTTPWYSNLVILSSVHSTYINMYNTTKVNLKLVNCSEGTVCFQSCIMCYIYLGLLFAVEYKHQWGVKVTDNLLDHLNAIKVVYCNKEELFEYTVTCLFLMPFSWVYPVSVAAVAAHVSWRELSVRQCQRLLNG